MKTFLPPWESGNAGPTVGVCEEDPGKAYDWSHIHENVKAMRRMFVVEYLKDFNGQNAMLRMGIAGEYSTARETANRWLREPFTQYVLDQYIDEAKEAAFITRNRIIAGLLREANAYGLDTGGSARVSAYGKLAKIMGLEIVKTEVSVTTPGVMLVPLGGTPDEWEKAAAKAQADLKVSAVA